MQKVSSQKNWLLILCSLLIFSLVASLIPGIVLADEEKAPFDSPYFEVIVDDEGRELIKAIFPLPPPETKVAAAAVPDVHIAGAINSLLNVPAFDWCYGCSATAAAMLFGYYDRTFCSDMYTGPTGGGVCPLDNSGWGNGECPLSATHKDFDGRAIRGHVDDYWMDYAAPGPDPWVDSWTEHTLGDCTGDYMGTNQWKYGSPVVDANYDGSTLFYFDPTGDPLYDYTGAETTYRDGCHGMKLFAQSRSYTVVENFTQLILGKGSDPNKGFTFADFQAEIDAGRPVLIHLEGHTMLGYGYNDTTADIIYVHDTWDHSSHTMTWGGTYPYGEGELQHWAVTVIQLSTPSTAIEIVSKVDDTAVTNITFPTGQPEDTVSSPFNTTDGSGDPQLLSDTDSSPVVRLLNNSGGNLIVWLGITGWENGVVTSEDYKLVDITDTTVDLVDNVLSSDGSASSVDTGITINDTTYKALYLEVVLSTTPGLSGGSTLTILGEIP